jgi:putative ABC transport system substrate-binding protein
VKRREFIALLGGAAAWPLAAHAQQATMTRVGIVTIQPRTASMYAAFDQRLRELGYVEIRNIKPGALSAQSRSSCAGRSISSL